VRKGKTAGKMKRRKVAGGLVKGCDLQAGHHFESHGGVAEKRPHHFVGIPVPRPVNHNLHLSLRFFSKLS
jgi:hypothetical protein